MLKRSRFENGPRHDISGGILLYYVSDLLFCLGYEQIYGDGFLRFVSAFTI